MAKIIDTETPSLQEVNDNLLRRLNSLIEDADDEKLLNLTEALAKLNSSYKGNTNFVAPETDKEKDKKGRVELVQSLMTDNSVQEGEVIDAEGPSKSIS